MAEYRASSFDDLLGRLYGDAWQPHLGRFRSAFAFRGVQGADADLTTTLARLGGPYARQEGHLLRNFRKYAHRDAVTGDSIWNWLSLAKHHGLPTRLLDWTYSPFVALHFATQDVERFDQDGVVWCVNYSAAHRLLPAKLRQILKQEQADVFTAAMLDRVADDLPALDRLAKPGGRGRGEGRGARGQSKDGSRSRGSSASRASSASRGVSASRGSGTGPFVLFMEPPSLDDRIVNQFALFSLMSSPEAQIEPWLAGHAGVYDRIIIPAKLKWEVRDKLDQANVTERVLFPGLDGLSRWLKRYYSPRTDVPSARLAREAAEALESEQGNPDAARRSDR